MNELLLTILLAIILGLGCVVFWQWLTIKRQQREIDRLKREKTLYALIKVGTILGCTWAQLFGKIKNQA